MRLRSFAGDRIRKKDGWRVSIYGRLEDKFPTVKIRRTDKIPFSQRYELARLICLGNPAKREELLRWLLK